MSGEFRDVRRIALSGIAATLVTCVSVIALAQNVPFEVRNARTAGISDKVKASADGTARWKYTAGVVVGASTGETATEGLTARLDPLEAEGGRTSVPRDTRATLAALPAKLAPGQTIALELEAAFPSAGDYRGELLLLQGSAQRVVPVAIKVEAAVPGDPPLVEHGKAIVTLTESLDGDASTLARVALRNTGAAALTLGAPRVVSARRVDKLPEATRETQVGAEVDSWSSAPIGTIAGGEVSRFDIGLRGLGGPGIYQVEVLTPVTGYAPKVVTFTVSRRLHWSRAVLWIALGVLLAYGVRRFVEGGKERMIVRRTLADVRPLLTAIRDEAREPGHVAAAQVLAAEIDRQAREVRWQGDGKVLLVSAERLVARVYLLGEIVAAARGVDRLTAEAQVAPRKALDEALAVVRVDPGPDKDKAWTIDEQRRKVAALAVQEAWRAELRAGVAELKASLEAFAKASDPTVRGQIDRELRPVLARAQEALAANQLEATAAALRELRTEFLTLAVADLRKRLANVPLGVKKDDWPAIVGPATNDLQTAEAAGDWASKYRAFLTAQRAYFKAAIGGLLAHAEARASDTQRPAKDPGRLKTIAAEFRAELAAGDLGLDRVATVYGARLAEVKQAAAIKGEGQEVAGGLVPAPVPWLALPNEPGELRKADTPAEVRRIDKAIDKLELMVMFAVLLVAVASGVKALWLGDVAWGADGDCLNAFLWGAGVGAVGDAFTGLVGLREKLGRPG